VRVGAPRSWRLVDRSSSSSFLTECWKRAARKNVYDPTAYEQHKRAHSVGSYYLLHHEERPKQQFLLEHDSFTALMPWRPLHNEEQERLLASLRHDSESIKKSFLKLVSNHERPGSGDHPLCLRRRRKRTGGPQAAAYRLRDLLSDALRLEALIDGKSPRPKG